MTFSIAARCVATGRFAAAVASSSAAVAARCPVRSSAATVIRSHEVTPLARRPPAHAARVFATTHGAARRHLRHVAHARPVAGEWLMAWAASPQRAVPGTPAMSGLRRQTMREIVFTSAGGSAVRVRFTNAFGGRPLEIGDASIAIAGAGANLRSEPVPLTFAGKRSVAIAPGAETLSDPAALDVAPLQALAVSVFVAGDGGRATEHADAQQVNYVAAGDHVDDLSTAPFATRSRAWEFLDGVEVPAQRQELGTVIPMGDSITDGVGSLPGKDARWPNDLARRLERSTAGG